MEGIKVFKLLQAHVSVVNEAAANLYNEKISVDAAYGVARAEMEKTLAALKALADG